MQSGSEDLKNMSAHGATCADKGAPLRLVLYETSANGHRGAYLVAISSEAARRGWSVTVVTPARDRVNQYFDALRDLLGAQNLIFTPYSMDFPKRVSALSMVRYHLDEWRACRQSLATVPWPFDTVYAPNIDYMDKAMQLRGAPSYPVPMGGMTMRARFHLKSLGVETHGSLLPSLAALSFYHLLNARGVSCITTADPSLARYCERQRAARYRKVSYVPELGMRPPSIDPRTAKSAFGFGHDDKIILIFGFIDARKACTQLLESLERVDPGLRIRVLIVGRPDQATLSALTGSRFDSLRDAGVLVTRLEFADNEMQDLAFAAADAVWTAYHEHSTMSGVFAQALSCSLPVIGPDYGLLSWLISQYKVGICVNIANPADTAGRIEAMFRDIENFKTFRANAKSISERHLPQSFGSAVCDAISATRTSRSAPHSTQQTAADSRV